MRIAVQHKPLQDKLIKLAEDAGVSPTAYVAHLIAEAAKKSN